MAPMVRYMDPLGKWTLVLNGTPRKMDHRCINHVLVYGPFEKIETVPF